MGRRVRGARRRRRGRGITSGDSPSTTRLRRSAQDDNKGTWHEVRGPLMATGFFTDTTLCIGCKACEVACKQWNELPSDGFSWSGNSYDNTTELSATSWRHVKFIEQFTSESSSELVTLETE